MTDKIETIEIHGESSVDWKATAFRYMELNKQKIEAIQRVRELHKMIKSSKYACGDSECCGDYEECDICEYCYDDYPCDTIKALDGEQ